MVIFQADFGSLISSVWEDKVLNSNSQNDNIFLKQTNKSKLSQETSLSNDGSTLSERKVVRFPGALCK